MYFAVSRTEYGYKKIVWKIWTDSSPVRISYCWRGYGNQGIRNQTDSRGNSSKTIVASDNQIHPAPIPEGNRLRRRAAKNLPL